VTPRGAASYLSRCVLTADPHSHSLTYTYLPTYDPYGRSTHHIRDITVTTWLALLRIYLVIYTLVYSDHILLVFFGFFLFTWPFGYLLSSVRYITTVVHIINFRRGVSCRGGHIGTHYTRLSTASLSCSFLSGCIPHVLYEAFFWFGRFTVHRPRLTWSLIFLVGPICPAGYVYTKRGQVGYMQRHGVSSLLVYTCSSRRWKRNRSRRSHTADRERMLRHDSVIVTICLVRLRRAGGWGGMPNEQDGKTFGLGLDWRCCQSELGDILPGCGISIQNHLIFLHGNLPEVTRVLRPENESKNVNIIQLEINVYHVYVYWSVCISLERII